ncbi:MAG: DUF1801 domain-containing protein [Cyclobacteriaceae bacterium]
MQYDASTVAEYLDLLEDDWRKPTLNKIREFINSKAPGLTEGIHYKMLSYGDEKGSLFYLNAQKNYVSLYVGDTKKIDPDGVLLKSLDLGKGCIRFKKSTDPAETRIHDFIIRAQQLWDQGVDVGC